MPTSNAIRRLRSVAQNVADYQFWCIKLMERGGQPTTKRVKSVPLGASFGYHYVPHQMTEVDWSFRVTGRMEDVSRAAVPGEMRVEIFLYDPDDWHGGLAACCLCILDQFAKYDSSFNVQNFLVPIVVIPPKSLEFFRPQSSERQYHEGSLSGVMIDCGHQVVNFFEGVRMGIGFVASDTVGRGNRIEINQASTDSRSEGPAQSRRRALLKY